MSIDIGKTTEEIFDNISYSGETPILHHDAYKWHPPAALEKIATGFFGTGKEHIESNISPNGQLECFMPIDGLLSLYSYILYPNKIPAVCFFLDMCTRYVSTNVRKDSGFGVIGLLREILGYVSRIKGKKQIQSKPSKN